MDLESGLLAKGIILSAFQRSEQFIYFSISDEIRRKNLKIEVVNINTHKIGINTLILTGN